MALYTVNDLPEKFARGPNSPRVSLSAAMPNKSTCPAPEHGEEELKSDGINQDSLAVQGGGLEPQFV